MKGVSTEQEKHGYSAPPRKSATEQIAARFSSLPKTRKKRSAGDVRNVLSCGPCSDRSWWLEFLLLFVPAYPSVA